MSARDREQYAKRRNAVLERKRAQWRATHPVPDWLCGACRGKTRTQWCRRCRATVSHRAHTEPHPDYVSRAEAKVSAETGKPRNQFGPAEHRLVTLTLVQWARERQPNGPLKDYSPDYRKYEGTGR